MLGGIVKMNEGEEVKTDRSRTEKPIHFAESKFPIFQVDVQITDCAINES